MKKAMIAMSGGVDSSVAAWLMKRDGYDCMGVTMRLFAGEDSCERKGHTCCSLDDVEDARSVADGLNQKKAVVLNLESVNGETARRILDFLSGVTYANKATMRQVANGTFLITPHNVDVNGDLLGELSSSGYSFDR